MYGGWVLSDHGLLSAHSARPPKIPGWIVVVRENFSLNIWVS